MAARSWVLGAAVWALAAAPAAAQDVDDQRKPDYLAPRPLLFPRQRAGWLPVHATLANPGDARATLRFRLIDPVSPDRTRTVLEAEIEGGATRPAVGYVWGSNPRWGHSQPQSEVRLVGPGGRFSPEARIPQRPSEGWQVATLLDTGPGGTGLPARIPALIPAGGVRPGLAPNVPAGRNTPAAKRAALLAQARKTVIHTRPLAPGLLPTHVVGWDPADCLLISSRAPLERLTLAERTAALQWVALGGVVLIDASAPVTSLGKPLCAELLAGRPGDARSMVPPAAAAVPDAGPDPAAMARVLAGRTVTVVPPPAGFEPLESWAGVPVLAVRRHGYGCIYYSATDCTRAHDGRAADLGPLLLRVLEDARTRRRDELEPLGARWPGQPCGEARYFEVWMAALNDRISGKQRWYYGYNASGDRSATRDLAEALHTGRARMPSTLGVLVFLGCYLLALGPGVWWLRRRWGGGLIGIPITLGVALVFGLAALGFGLASRGIGLATQRVTYLWPVPGLPLAAESTGFSLYAGLGRRVDVHFPGQVAPLPVDRDGRVGDAFRLDVRFGTAGSDAVGIPVGAWQTRVLLAEGARAIGGPIAVTAAAATPGAPVTITNRSAMPLGPGVLWHVGANNVTVTPAVAAGATAQSLVPAGSRGQPSPLEALGLPMPERYNRRGMLAPVDGSPGRGLPSLTNRVVYVATVDPRDVPGGGPAAPGEHRITDRVLCVVPLQVVPR